MQPQQILSLMALFAIGAQALPLLSKDTLTIRTDADEDAANHGTYEGGTEKRADDADAAYRGQYQGGTDKRADADKAWKGAIEKV